MQKEKKRKHKRMKEMKKGKGNITTLEPKGERKKQKRKINGDSRKCFFLVLNVLSLSLSRSASYYTTRH